jgi:hypothetical protein
MELSLLAGTTSGGRRSTLQAARANCVNPQLCMGTQLHLDVGERGGIIIFTDDLNTTAKRRSLRKCLSSWLQSYWDRRAVQQRVSRILAATSLEAVNFGNYFRGHYTTDDGRVFSERSLAVEVLFVDSAGMERLATELARAFNQQVVLVKDSNTGKMYFADQT